MPRKVCLGGTFNVVHDGHLALLKKAFDVGDEIFIGLTSDDMASRRRDVAVQDYDTREKNLVRALADISGGKRFYIFRIDDEFGPAVRENFDAIVVSEETRSGADRINAARMRAGLKPLEVVAVPMVGAEDGRPISSTRVIRGQIDGKGGMQ